MSEAKILFDTVIKNGYCIGCGICAVYKDSPFYIRMNKIGLFIAEKKNEAIDLNQFKVQLLEICPFSNKSLDETALAEIYYPNIKTKTDEIGKYIECFVGYVLQGEFRQKGSSGGIAKWMGYSLLKQKEIDFLIQLSPNNTVNAEDLLFDYQIFDNYEDVLAGSKSAYYPSTLVNVIEKIKTKKGRYAITGVPCAVKALRLYSLKDTIIKERVKYILGIVCGGMKSANYSKLVAWELGVHPSNLVRIDFRSKYINRPANEKKYKVWNNLNAEVKEKDVGQIYGTGYAAGFFKPKACDFCDDVLAETADITFGDAWLKQYVSDSNGTSLVVVRNNKLLELLETANRNNDIKIESITPEEVARSQAGGLRHRRDGLSMRIEKKERNKEWYPNKRVKAKQFYISRERKRIYNLREIIANKSHVSFVKALEDNDLKTFHRKMNPLIIRFVLVNFSSLLPRLPRRLFLFFKNKFKKLI